MRVLAITDQLAKEHFTARERDEPVILDDDDGQWVVNPDGSAEPSDIAY